MAKVTQPSTLVGQRISGRYEIDALIGSSDTGEVFDARHVGFARRVAIKVVRVASSPETTERLHREAKALAALQHPNICNIHDVGELEDGRPFLVLERLYGESLRLRLVRTGRLPLLVTVDVFSQILSALHCAHAANLIHRDMNPGNVILSDVIGCSPVVKIIDFGIARNTEVTVRITRKGSQLGAPEYVAPEQLRSEGEIDRRADLFSVGVMLYETLTGEHPFRGHSPFDTTTKVLREPHRPIRELLPSLPSMIDGILARSLAKEVGERFTTAAEFLAAVQILGRV